MAAASLISSVPPAHNRKVSASRVGKGGDVSLLAVRNAVSIAVPGIGMGILDFIRHAIGIGNIQQRSGGGGSSSR